ncbi:MAG: GrdX family protein [Synergistaceae bacterium]|nr:GrdX family protein [Synergistaceae bacterium]
MSRHDTLLITNNEELCRSVRRGRFVDGSSLDVLVVVRDSVHRGSHILTHPLCGNLRPYQQPFRSVLIEEHPGELVDLESLSMIEEAVAVYQTCRDRLIAPMDLDEAVRADHAFIDAELMKDSLERYGQLRHAATLLRPAPLRTLDERR